MLENADLITALNHILITEHWMLSRIPIRTDLLSSQHVIITTSYQVLLLSTFHPSWHQSDILQIFCHVFLTATHPGLKEATCILGNWTTLPICVLTYCDAPVMGPHQSPLSDTTFTVSRSSSKHLFCTAV